MLKKSWLLMLLGAPLIGARADVKAAGPQVSAPPRLPEDPVDIRPLNRPQDNLFAGHSSHRSHASHRSSSGGGYATPRQEESAPQRTPTPRQSAPSESRGLIDQGSSRPTDPGRAAPVTPAPERAKPPTLSIAEKRTLQVMRVQIALNSLGLHTGEVNGVLDDATKEALKRFQRVKGLEASGLMTTETLNALGVPAVQ